jgi:enamine deaminase RidA (YjgF/YER057c/UK114 family)
VPEIRNVNPPSLPPAVGYSHLTEAGDLVFFGGQVGCDETGRITAPDDLVRQCAQAFDNLGRALEAAGCRPEQVVKLNYYVTDVAAYRAAAREIGRFYRALFGKHYPASTLVEVRALYDPDARFEVECVARRD